MLVNRNNYLLVKEFLKHKMDIGKLAKTSAQRYRFYLKHLLLWADEISLGNAQIIRPSFIQYLSEQTSPGSGLPLTNQTWKKILGTSTQFFNWAMKSKQKEFGTHINIWLDSLIIPRGLPQYVENEYVTFEEIIKIAALIIDPDNLALRRDQAAAALLYITGMRAGALLSLPLRAVDIERNLVRQWPDLGVKTKNGKAATTHFLPIPELIKIVRDWDKYIRSIANPDTPWYPPIKNNWGDQEISDNPPGKSRNQRLNKRLRILFGKAKITYKSSRKFRRGFTVYAYKRAPDLATLKAVSLNLMHGSTNITEQYYATFNDDDVKSRINTLTPDKDAFEIDKYHASTGQKLSKRELAERLIQLGNDIKSI